ncbi:MAG: MFS transporter [Acidimicrobiia bacterium]
MSSNDNETLKHEISEKIEELPSHLKFDPLVGHPKRKSILAVMCLSLVVIVLDNSILNVAIPTISQTLRASDQQLLWIIDAYTLIFAGLLLTAGTLGDRFGRRSLLQIGLTIFGLASLISAFSHSPTQLIIGRGLMGIGGAAIMPSTLSIITNVFPPKERAKAIGIWAAFAGIGVAIGPLTGGFLIEHFWWGSVFLVNIPVVIFGVLANAVLVPESKAEYSEKIDIIGAILSIIGLSTLLYAIIFGADDGFLKPGVLTAGAIAFISLVGFFTWESKTASPMLQLKFFKDKRFSAGAISITLTFFAMFGMSFLLSQYLQSVLGFTPLQSGVRFIPFAFAMIVTAPLSAKASAKFGTKQTVVTGLTLVLIALLAMSTLQVNDSYANVIWMMMLMACGMGLTMAPATSSVMNSLPREKAGVGSAMNDTTRMVGGALGLAVSGSVFASIYRDKLKNFPAIKDLLAAMESLGVSKNKQQELLTNLSDSLGKAIGIAKGVRDPSTIPDPTLKSQVSSLPAPVRERVSNSIVNGAQYSFVKGMHVGMYVSAIAVVIAITVALIWLPKHSMSKEQAEGTTI